MRLEYAKLGLKNLRHRQLRSWLTMIGIFIGIATVVSLIALGAGLKAAIASQFGALGNDRLVISAKSATFGPPGQDVAAPLTKADLKVVERSQYVKTATGRLLQPAQVEFNDKKAVVFAASMPEDAEGRALVLEVLNVDTAEGRYPESGDRLRATIGSKYATKDNVFEKPIRVGDTVYIQGKKIEIIGILDSGGSEQTKDAFLMDEDAMREVFDNPEEYSVIVAQVTSVDDMDFAAEAIAKNLRSSRGVDERKEDFTVETAQDIINSFNTIIMGVTAFLVGIAAISLLVGGIGIMNTMYTAVLERTKEIGIMKAVGATNEAILSIFLFESGMLGLAGGLIGVLLGFLFSQLVVFAGSAALGPGILSANISWQLILSALGFSFTVGAVAGTLPAYEASKLQPVEALRE
jgi:putative ABC transport system permease protein